MKPKTKTTVMPVITHPTATSTLLLLAAKFVVSLEVGERPDIVRNVEVAEVLNFGGEVPVIETMTVTESMIERDMLVGSGVCVIMLAEVKEPGAVAPTIPGIILGRGIGVVKPLKVYATTSSDGTVASHLSSVTELG